LGILLNPGHDRREKMQITETQIAGTRLKMRLAEIILCLPTDFPKLFQAALVVCVPTLCAECNLRRLRYATTEVIPKALGYCWPPLCGGDEVAFGGGPIVLNVAFCSSFSEA
jgi:hypothetical protein